MKADPPKSDALKNPRILIIDDTESIIDDFHKILGEPSDIDPTLQTLAAGVFGESTSPGAPGVPGTPGVAFSYHIDDAAQGEQGLTLVQEAIQKNQPYAVAFVDMRMPNGWDGLMTAQQIMGADQHIQIVFCTAYADYTWEQMAETLTDVHRWMVLKKPFDAIEVRQIAAAMTAKWALTRQAEINLHSMEEQVAQRTESLQKLTRQLQKSQDELQDKEARTRQILNLANDAFIATDINGLIIDWNTSAENIFGAPRDQAIGQPIETFIKPPAAQQGETMIQNILNACEAHQRGQMTGQTEEGRDFPVEVSISIVAEEDYFLFVLFVHDISVRAKMQQQLVQAQKLESIGQLAAGIAHEINTPTQYVGDNVRFLKDAFADLLGLQNEGWSKLLQAAKEGAFNQPLVMQIEQQIQKVDCDFLHDEIPRAIDEAIEGVTRVGEIVKSMKQFAHPGGAEMQLLNLNEAIESTMNISRNEWKYTTELETDLAPDLPSAMCLPGEINQVLLNLIVNAAHAIEERKRKDADLKGLIRIQTKQVDDWVEIHISDNGIGIPPEAQPKIFDPFFTTKQVGDGSGQGLAIAHNVITEKHQGAIEFITNPGEGTTFVIYLPLNPSTGERTTNVQVKRTDG